MPDAPLTPDAIRAALRDYARVESIAAAILADLRREGFFEPIVTPLVSVLHDNGVERTDWLHIDWATIHGASGPDGTVEVPLSIVGADDAARLAWAREMAGAVKAKREQAARRVAEENERHAQARAAALRLASEADALRAVLTVAASHGSRDAQRLLAIGWAATAPTAAGA